MSHQNSRLLNIVFKQLLRVAVFTIVCAPNVRGDDSAPTMDGYIGHRAIQAGMAFTMDVTDFFEGEDLEYSVNCPTPQHRRSNHYN